MTTFSFDYFFSRGHLLRWLWFELLSHDFIKWSSFMQKSLNIFSFTKCTYTSIAHRNGILYIHNHNINNFSKIEIISIECTNERERAKKKFVYIFCCCSFWFAFSRAHLLFTIVSIPYIEWELRLCIMYILYAECGTFFFYMSKHWLQSVQLPINWWKMHSLKLKQQFVCDCRATILLLKRTRKISTYLHTFFDTIEYLAAHFIQKSRHTFCVRTEQATFCYVYLGFFAFRTVCWRRESREFHSGTFRYNVDSARTHNTHKYTRTHTLIKS